MTKLENQIKKEFQKRIPFKVRCLELGNNEISTQILENGNIIAESQWNMGHGEEAEIFTFYVQDNKQNQGIGSGIVKSIEAILIQHNVKKIILNSLIDARPFWSRMGYQPLYGLIYAKQLPSKPLQQLPTAYHLAQQ